MTHQLPRRIATTMAAVAGLTGAVGPAAAEASAEVPGLTKASFQLERPSTSFRLPDFEGCQACTSGLDVFVIESRVLEQVQANRLMP